MIKFFDTENMSNVAGEGEEHSVIWRMLMVVTMNAATFMGKNFQNQTEFHYEYIRSHIEKNVPHISKIGSRTR